MPSVLLVHIQPVEIGKICQNVYASKSRQVWIKMFFFQFIFYIIDSLLWPHYISLCIAKNEGKEGVENLHHNCMKDVVIINCGYILSFW